MELEAGRGKPLPDYVQVIQEARYWRVSPMEIMEWPLEWIKRGQIVREAEARAQQHAMKRHEG